MKEIREKRETRAECPAYSIQLEPQRSLPAGLAATSCGALQGRRRESEGGARKTLGQSQDKGVAAVGSVSDCARINTYI